ncbi:MULTISPECIES: peptidoglycan-binding protein [unclassified Mesorhizobium]|uniref:peptidoglycan-binding protein n=1 Tax=unclassified Mesorhizobium TaxID=325217 RepID=UPI00112E9EFE|nr:MULTISPECIES: peptidoglycan-binding protein [unclassified Mesorhizobium]MCA0056829.1 peptidoglycan-binding protein [Mesorhizobium sp. B261B1A]TPL08202.1 hypothetical protein FJ944_18710 [Mesorhizobium sp. B2-4-11]
MNNVLRSLLAAVFFAFSICCNSAFAETASTELISFESLSKFSPRARSDLVLAIVQNWDQAESAGIKSELRIRHLLAQFATETGGLRRLDENLNYSEPQILRVFGTRVTEIDAAQLAHRPIELANKVYGYREDLGNGGPNDGWNYRGSGYIQLTGRTNFRNRGEELHLPLEQDPDLARRSVEGFQAAIAFWNARKINKAADLDSVYQVRLLVNGGTNGLADAKIWYARAKRYLISVGQNDQAASLDETLAAEERSAVQEKLEDLGFMPPEGAPADIGVVSQGLKAFQHSRGLPETGQMDEDTLYAITDPDERARD